ncbi:MAG: hypothetical protein M0R46_08730 [Candidatus Muirbacterium halophilum]|nr:hypothetical protein [Candidatus Muirbacterium halophilum]MCK9475989.1 hypothetical protein [Candidatus Muirbacterium halophilum]
MKINGICNNGLKICKNKKADKKDISEKKTKKKEIECINIQASKTDIESFKQARKITEKIKNDIKKHGTDLIDHSKISGKKIFDLLQD